MVQVLVREPFIQFANRGALPVLLPGTAYTKDKSTSLIQIVL